MTALIWMLTWLPHVLPAMSDLPRPVNLNLSSEHFHHLLTWEPGPGTPGGVHYQVTMNTPRGSSWRPAAGCERVERPLLCNLTEAFSDRHEVYFTQVTALLAGRASPPAVQSSHGFCPARDTHLDLPLLTVTPCEKNLCVDLQPPVENLRSFYESVRFKLRVESSSGVKTLEVESFRRRILEDMAPGTPYCVSICFSDSMLPRNSSYSKPVCASTRRPSTADPVISSVLCLLVLLGLAVLAFLVSAGYICLRKRPLPQVLTSIHHLEEVLVAAPSRVSLASLLSLRPTAPSAGAKRCSQTSSDDSDESETEETGDSGGGGGYNLRVGADFSSSSTSQTSSSAPPPAEAEPSSSSEPPSDLVDTHTLGQTAAETHSCSGLNDTLSSHTHSPSPQQDSEPPAGGAQPKEERVERQEGSQNVNLLTLTFGRHEEEEEQEEEQEKLLRAEPPSASEEQNTTATLQTQTRDTEEAAGETTSCSEDKEEEEEDEEDEEEEEEDSGYIRR